MAVPSVSPSSSSVPTGNRPPTAGQPIADDFLRYCGAQQFQLGRQKVDSIERRPFDVPEPHGGPPEQYLQRRSQPREASI
jgi:hypothetical protein